MIRYALAPETFKLVYGSYQQFHPTQIDEMPGTISLSTARGMNASFQLLVCKDTPWALNVGKTPHLSQKGAIPTLRVAAPEGVSLHIEDMHVCDDGYFRADALLDDEVTEQAADYTRAVYCEVEIPADAPAGKKTVTLALFESTMFEDEKKVGEVTAEIEVFSVTMHKPSENKFYLDLWQHLSNIARKHEVRLWSDEHFAALEPYVKSLADLGQKAVTLVVTEAPWGGQSCFREYRMEANLFEYSIVPLTKTAEGELVADFTHLQRYVDLCAKYGIEDELSLYGLSNVWCMEEAGFGRLAPDDPDALRVRYLDEADGTYKFLRTEEELETYIRLLADYFKKTGQMEKVRIAADEPADLEKYRRSLERLMRIEPEFRFKAALNHSEFIEEFGKEIYDFVPYSGHLFTHLELLRKYRDTMPGKRFLWYVCCVPHWPNTFLRSDLCESLFIGAFTSWSRMQGFLRWNYTVWNDDPRKDIRYGDFLAGDTNFVYPSPSGKPLLTLRYKALRKGIWLYELLEMLRDAKGDELTDTLIGRVVKNTETDKYYTDGHWLENVVSLHWEDYEGLIREILHILAEKD